MKYRRVIKAGGVAKRLMLQGHLCVDVAPQRDNPGASRFIFYTDPWLASDVDEIIKGGNAENTLKARLAALGMTEAEYRRHIFDKYLESLERERNAEKAG